MFTNALLLVGFPFSAIPYTWYCVSFGWMDGKPLHLENLDRLTLPGIGLNTGRIVDSVLHQVNLCCP